MPHQILKVKGPLAGHSKAKKSVSGLKKRWQSDKNPVQKHLNKKAGIADEKTAGGRIQKDLVKGGWSKTELRHKQEEHKRKQKAKADRKALKKSNPKKYKEMRKKELKIERQKAFSRGSHTWD